MGSLDVFQGQFHRLKDVEDGKDQLIERLFIRTNELESGLTETKLHLEREQDNAKLYQSKLAGVRASLKKLNERIDSNSFVSVLIDGDCMAFCDDFVKSAQQGGIEAIHWLKSKVCEYVSKELELPSQMAIRVRIFANTKGLASVYCCNKILNSADDLHMFVRGFNMGYSMCDFVDAGDGKECADAKLKACFNHDMSDVQCRAIMFGGSADNGYARLLQPYAGDDPKSNRIVLLEGPPFAKELALLKRKFLVARLLGVFRNTKLWARRLSLSMTPPTISIPNDISSPAKVVSPVAPDVVNTEEASNPSASPPVRKNYPLLRDSKGHRLDAILSPPTALVIVMRSTRHCNPFHILGECNYEDCKYLHGVRLNKKGIEARRLISRYKPCPSKLKCKDEKCLLGHECPEKTCARIGKGCRFPKEMHNVDRP